MNDTELLRKLRGHMSTHRTICQIHRELYHLIKESDMPRKLRDTLVESLVEAFACGLRMARRLHEYNAEYKVNFDDFYEKNLTTKHDLDKKVWRKLNEK